MKPILYTETEKEFTTNGIGILSDAIDCTVIQALNGAYELEMTYPICGIHFAEIQRRRIIMAKPDPVSKTQPFRIYRISKPMRGTATVYARHLAYDMMGIPVAPFSAEGVGAALITMKNNAVVSCPFTFWTDKTTASAITTVIPMAMWSLLGGTEGSLLDTFGGEYEFDRYLVRLRNRRGADRGVSIRYGKNLTSLQQEENCAGCYTGVYPYWTSPAGEYVELPEKIVECTGNYNYTNILMKDFSEQWQEMPTAAQLRGSTLEYIVNNNIGTPEVSWKVEFVQLEQTEEYRGKALLERVLLGDTVTVEFAAMGVSAAARVVEVRYKPILERYENVSLGSVRSNIADIVVNQQKELEKKPDLTAMEMAVQVLTRLLLGAKGGSVRLLDTDGDGFPDTLYIADDPDPNKAMKVWRFNYEGWGASSKGFNGPFIMGATLEGGMVADFITSGKIKAELIDVENLVASRLLSKHGVMEISIKDGLMQFKVDGEDVGGIALQKRSGVLAFLGDETNTPSVRLSNHQLWYTLENTARAVLGVDTETRRGYVKFDDLRPSLEGNCKWEYFASLGKTVLVLNQ